MIHFHTSKIFGNDLTKAGCALSPPENPAAGWHWYAHRITLLREKCVIVMEETSRYALFFHALKKSDLAGFDKLLGSRIIAEASWLCDLPPGLNEKLIEAVERQCSSTVWSQGMNRSVQAHIRQVADEVEYLVKYRFERLPESTEEAFTLGAMINDTLRKRGGDKDYFYPLERWRESLLALLQPQDRSNVVTLADFKKGRKNV